MEKQTKEKTKKAFILSPSVVVGVIGIMVIILLGVAVFGACWLANSVRELGVIYLPEHIITHILPNNEKNSFFGNRISKWCIFRLFKHMIMPFGICSAFLF